MKETPALRAIVFVAALASAALTARLGLWQWDRAAQKLALQAAIEGRATAPEVGAAELAGANGDAATGLLHRNVRLRGRWLADRTVFLDNRPLDARAGFIVITPLQWPGGVVLVQRGWAPRDNDDRTRLPAVVTPGGEVEVAGRIAGPPSRLFEFGGVVSGPIRQNLDLAQFASEIGLALMPVTVLQGGPNAADSLLRKWPLPAADAHKNYGYAAQWWALSGLILGLYVWYQIVRPRLRRDAR